MGVANSASKPLASSCGEEETVVKNLILFYCTLQPLQEVDILVSLVLAPRVDEGLHWAVC